jgi:hypothetical protein
LPDNVDTPGGEGPSVGTAGDPGTQPSPAATAGTAGGADTNSAAGDTNIGGTGTSGSDTGTGAGAAGAQGTATNNAQPEPPPLDSVVEQQVQSQGTGSSSSVGGNLTPAGTEKYNLQLDQTRKAIAMFLLWILVAVVALYMIVALFYSARCFYDAQQCGGGERALSLLTNGVTPIFTAMIGVIGSVVGFYFGSKRD